MTVLCRWCRKKHRTVPFYIWLFYWLNPLYPIIPCEDCYSDVADSLPPC